MVNCPEFDLNDPYTLPMETVSEETAVSIRWTRTADSRAETGKA